MTRGAARSRMSDHDDGAPFLAPIVHPKHPMLKLGFVFMRRQYGKVASPMSVFCARMPFAFTSFYGKVFRLDKKLSLPDGLAMLVREHVANLNRCLYCMDANRAAAIKKTPSSKEKFDALPGYRTSPLFDDVERVALNYATEVTRDRVVSDATFVELSQRFSERQICEIVWLVASEHLYNINNIALNIGSDGYCQLEEQRLAKKR
jgi:alkylhydroperoxidase family enzyme